MRSRAPEYSVISASSLRELLADSHRRGSGPLTRVSSHATAGSFAVCDGTSTHTNVSPIRWIDDLVELRSLGLGLPALEVVEVQRLLLGLDRLPRQVLADRFASSSRRALSGARNTSMLRCRRAPAARSSRNCLGSERAGLSAVLPECGYSGPSTTRRTSASSGTSAGVAGRRVDVGEVAALSPRRVALASRRRISSSTSSSLNATRPGPGPAA